MLDLHRVLERTLILLKLMSRKAAVPVPGPIGGGSLSDWKEAEGKGNSKSGNSGAGNSKAGNSKAGNSKAGDSEDK